jgi:hypothetical protein
MSCRMRPAWRPKARGASGPGRAPARDCAARVLHAADILGIRGIVAHAASEEAKAGYLVLGFEVSSLDPMTLMVTLADVRTAFQDH